MKAMAALLTSLALSGCSAEQARTHDDEVDVPLARLASDEARHRGRVLFKRRCALCHGERADGRGVRSKGLSRKPVDFTSATWRAGATPAQVFRILKEGMRGTSMPAWPALSDDQKWDVVAYVLSVAEEGP